jgi:hypothetical protein
VVTNHIAERRRRADSTAVPAALRGVFTDECNRYIPELPYRTAC